jgi:hypothetical protein
VTIDKFRRMRDMVRECRAGDERTVGVPEQELPKSSRVTQRGQPETPRPDSTLEGGNADIKIAKIRVRGRVVKN